MSEGALSSTWVQGTTRFTPDALEAVVQKTVSARELESLGPCAICGHSRMVPGRLQDLGRMYFRPARTRFWVLHEAVVPVNAVVCTACGHIEMRADTRKLSRLLPAGKSEEED